MTTKKINYLQTGSQIPEYVDTLSYKDYKLQKGDYLYIQIHALDPKDVLLYNGPFNRNLQNAGDDAASRLYLYLIEEDGCIYYPYIGRIMAEGKTVREVKFDLEDVFKEFVSDYSVDVKISNRTFSIIGEAGAGRYFIPKEKLTIFEAMAMSGGLSLYSDRAKIKLIRQTTDGVVVKEFDIRAKSIINSEYYYIQPNDVLYVQFDNAKYFGVNHITTAISTALGTFSFALMIYNVVNNVQQSSK